MKKYPMCESQLAQIDCRIEICRFYQDAKCINVSPAITLNQNGKFVCWSMEKIMNGLDSQFVQLSDVEKEAFKRAVNRVVLEAQNNRHKRPKVTTILEEVAEMILSFRGKHDDPPDLELVHIASVCINVLWQLEMGLDVNNIVTYKNQIGYMGDYGNVGNDPVDR